MGMFLFWKCFHKQGDGRPSLKACALLIHALVNTED